MEQEVTSMLGQQMQTTMYIAPQGVRSAQEIIALFKAMIEKQMNKGQVNFKDMLKKDAVIEIVEIPADKVESFKKYAKEYNLHYGIHTNKDGVTEVAFPKEQFSKFEQALSKTSILEKDLVTETPNVNIAGSTSKNNVVEGTRYRSVALAHDKEKQFDKLADEHGLNYYVSRGEMSSTYYFDKGQVSTAQSIMEKMGIERKVEKVNENNISKEVKSSLQYFIDRKQQHPQPQVQQAVLPQDISMDKLLKRDEVKIKDTKEPIKVKLERNKVQAEKLNAQTRQKMQQISKKAPSKGISR